MEVSDPKCEEKVLGLVWFHCNQTIYFFKQMVNTWSHLSRLCCRIFVSLFEFLICKKLMMQLRCRFQIFARLAEINNPLFQMASFHI